MLRRLIPIVILSISVVILLILFNIAIDNITLAPAVKRTVSTEPVSATVKANNSSDAKEPRAGEPESRVAVVDTALTAEPGPRSMPVINSVQPENIAASLVTSINEAPNAGITPPAIATSSDATLDSPGTTRTTEAVMMPENSADTDVIEKAADETPVFLAEILEPVIASTALTIDTTAVGERVEEISTPLVMINSPVVRELPKFRIKHAIPDEIPGQKLAKVIPTPVITEYQPVQRLTLEKFMAAKWSVNGTSTALLPSTLTQCLRKSGRIECWSQVHPVDIKDKGKKAKTRSLIQDFSSAGFTVKYKHMFLSAEPPGRKWDDTTYLLNCTVITAIRIICTDRKSNKKTIFTRHS